VVAANILFYFILSNILKQCLLCLLIIHHISGAWLNCWMVNWLI